MGRGLGGRTVNHHAGTRERRFTAPCDLGALRALGSRKAHGRRTAVGRSTAVSRPTRARPQRLRRPVTPCGSGARRPGRYPLVPRLPEAFSGVGRLPGKARWGDSAPWVVPTQPWGRVPGGGSVMQFNQSIRIIWHSPEDSREASGRRSTKKARTMMPPRAGPAGASPSEHLLRSQASERDPRPQLSLRSSHCIAAR